MGHAWPARRGRRTGAPTHTAGARYRSAGRAGQKEPRQRPKVWLHEAKRRNHADETVGSGRTRAARLLRTGTCDACCRARPAQPAIQERIRRDNGIRAFGSSAELCVIARADDLELMAGRHGREMDRRGSRAPANGPEIRGPPRGEGVPTAPAKRTQYPTKRSQQTMAQTSWPLIPRETSRLATYAWRIWITSSSIG